MNQLHSVTTQFGLPQRLQFIRGRAGLPVAHITAADATAEVALQGAQVLAWQPAGQAPVIWLSEAALFAPRQAVRGGIPVCWPWFGNRADLPAHGFVRTRVWQVRATSVDDAGQVTIRLGLVDDAATRAQWDHAFDLTLEVTVGATLTLALTTRNTGAQAFTLTQALHSYFSVGDISRTSVHGLDGCHYLDKVQGFAEQVQTGDIRFDGETDRIFVDTTADCLINDAAWGRTLRVAKQGSASTVVWNPGAARAVTLPDMAPGGQQGMVCVETCNAGPDQIMLAPGAQHTLRAHISVQ